MDPLDTCFRAVHYRAGAWVVCTDHSGEIVSPPLTRRQAQRIAGDLNAVQPPLFPPAEQLKLFED